MHPACSIPGYIEIALEGQGTPQLALSVEWQGAATLYKLKWRRDEEVDWHTVTLPGPGSSGGSGLFNDGPADNDVNQWEQEDIRPSAIFNFSVNEGWYVLRLFNVCEDGSDYYVERRFLVTAKACAEAITGLKVVKLSALEIGLAWDELAGREGTYTVIYNELDEAGSVAHTNSEQTNTNSYTIKYPPAARFAISVVTPCGEYATVESPTILVSTRPEDAGVGGGDIIVNVDAPDMKMNHVHSQESPSASWTVAHNLGFYPNVRTVDREGNAMEGIPEDIDVNNMVIHFNKPVSGYAYLS